MLRKIVVSCIATAMMTALFGCSSEEIEPLKMDESPAVAPTSLKPQMKVPQVNTRDLVVDVDVDARRGAAIEEGAAKHYLSKDEIGENSPLLLSNVKYDRRNPLSYENMVNAGNTGNGNTTSPDALKLIQDNFNIGSISDYSYYELSRWQRFCNHGKNMDRLDWRFIKNKTPRRAKLMCSTFRTRRSRARATGSIPTSIPTMTGIRCFSRILRSTRT